MMSLTLPASLILPVDTLLIGFFKVVIISFKYWAVAHNNRP